MTKVHFDWIWNGSVIRQPFYRRHHLSLKTVKSLKIREITVVITQLHTCFIRSYIEMSWDSHIESLQASGANDACICDQDGNVWAKSKDFNPSQKEIVTMIKVAKGQPIQDSEKLELNQVPMMKIRDLAGDHVGGYFGSKNAGEKTYCSVAFADKAVVFVTMKGQGQRRAVEICETEVKYLKDTGY